MDQSKAIALATVVIAVALRGQTFDPAEALERARDEYLASRRQFARQTCIETIDRSYFSRKDPPHARVSCEQLHLDRMSPGFKLNLDMTDRVRVKVAFEGDREIYSWPPPGRFSAGVDEIVESGSFGTGSFGTFLLDIFANPAVRFRLLDGKTANLNFGYRVPVEGSHYYVRAGGQWRATSYDGSISIDAGSVQVHGLIMKTSELPPESLMCEASSILEFGPMQENDPLVPRRSKSQAVLRNSDERESVTTFSGCGESEIPGEAAAATPVLPPGVSLTLALQQPVDWQTSAAGDTISAEVAEPVMEPKSGNILLAAGTVVSGRILRLVHQVKAPARFFVTIGFDALDTGGVRSRFYAKAIPGPHSGTFSNQERPRALWPDGTFTFSSRNSTYVLGAGFKSKWMTMAR